MRIVLRTGGALARVLSRSLAAAGRTWRRAGWLGRLTQLAGWLLLAGLLLVPAGEPDSTWRLDRNISLTVIGGGLLAGAIALLLRRVVRRIRRPRDDERAWQARELLYAAADREGHDVLLVNSEQYRAGVGQRCWTMHEATGEIEDTWFAGQTSQSAVSCWLSGTPAVRATLAPGSPRTVCSERAGMTSSSNDWSGSSGDGTAPPASTPRLLSPKPRQSSAPRTRRVDAARSEAVGSALPVATSQNRPTTATKGLR